MDCGTGPPHSFVLAARTCRSDGAVEWMAQSLDRSDVRSVGRLHVLATNDTDALDQGLLRALLEVQVYHPVTEAAAAPLQVYVTSATARHRLLTSSVCTYALANRALLELTRALVHLVPVTPPHDRVGRWLADPLCRRVRGTRPPSMDSLDLLLRVVQPASNNVENQLLLTEGGIVASQ